MASDQIIRLARGSWQRQIVRDMLGYGCVNPLSCLRGRASRYGIHYRASFHNLLARLAAHGVQIDRTPGPRGGEYSAVYSIHTEA